MYKGKFLYYASLLFPIALLVICLSSFIAVKNTLGLAVLSLFTPVFFIGTLLLTAFWLFKNRKRSSFFILSIVVALLVFQKPFHFNQENATPQENDISIMTYNVRGFNENGHLNIQNADSLIITFIRNENPDVLCLQESFYAMKRSKALNKYPYRYVDFEYGTHDGRVIQSIYSKYPILQVEPITFPKSNNSALFADILVEKDTIRLYNLHLQSFNVVPKLDNLASEKSGKLFQRMQRAMVSQEQQARIILKHSEPVSYSKIIVGDFNNTQFSYTYRSLKGDMQDTFIEKGEGFGRTFELFGLPMRIDYIMADTNFEVTSHTNYDVEYSDHYPVMATLKLKSDETAVD